MRLMKKCEQCQLKYDVARNIKYKHHDFCSRLCSEDWIDVQSQVLGAFIGRDPRYAVIPQGVHDV